LLTPVLIGRKYFPLIPIAVTKQMSLSCCVEWGDSKSHSDMAPFGGKCGAAVHGCDCAEELGELVHVVGSAPRRKHVVGQVIDVVPLAVVETEEYLHMLPHALDHVYMSTSTHIKVTDRVVDGLVFGAFRGPGTPTSIYSTPYCF
jgi:hypothetical protein